MTHILFHREIKPSFGANDENNRLRLNIKMSSIKSSENIQKKESGPDRSVSDNQSSSVTLNELATNARKSYCNFKFQQTSHTMTDMNPNEVQMI